MPNGLIVNGRSLGRRVTGVERYASEVVKRLPVGLKVARPRRVLNGLAGQLWEQAVLPRLVGEDLLWSPANSGPLSVRKQVVTIHDAFPLDHPEWYQPAFALWYRLMLPALAKRASYVVTVSEYARRRLIRLLGISREKIYITPGGVDPARFQPIRKERQIQFRTESGFSERYILFVGSIEPRKNLLRLLRAWEIISRHLSRVDLVLAGGTAPVFPRTFNLLQPNVKWVGYFPENELPALYGSAEALIIPSLDEGFGLTALEAMACGTPVIAACSGALPEVIGEAGVWINPADPVDIARGIFEVLSDADLQHELRKRGISRAERFSWDQTAALLGQTLEAAMAA